MAAGRHNARVTLFLKFLKALYFILFAAGYLSIMVLASIMSKGSNPGLGQAIEVTALAMGAVLGLGLILVEHRRRRALKQHENSPVHATGAPPLNFGAHESYTFGDDAETVWALIRPAESAVLLANAQRAFTVPGTPSGVGEQQCFIGSDGSVSIIEVVGEKSPHWATTRILSPAEQDIRQTYQLDSSASGCSLRIGVALEAQTTDEWLTNYEAAWRAHTRQYLARVAHVLAMQRRPQQDTSSE